MDEAETRGILIKLKAAIGNRNRHEINQLCGLLINQQARIGEQWKSIAALLRHHGEFDATNKAMALYTAQHHDSTSARFDQAAILAQTGRVEVANDILNTLPDTVPDPAGNAYIRATIATNMGDGAQARHFYLKLLDINPMSGQGWLGLSMLGPMDDASAELMLSLRTRFKSQPATERSKYLYAASKVLDGRREFDAAFAAISEGAALEQAQRPYSETNDRQNAYSILGDWPKDGTIANPAALERDLNPIFVTGLPRSGTTLVEQILASHSQVIGGGEIGLMRIVAQEMGGSTSSDLKRHISNGGGVRQLSDFYLHLLRQQSQLSGFFVDKSLDTSRYMGLVSTILPDAPILWVRRDPLDCAWSAYRTYFLNGVSWSWSLTDIAAHFKLEDHLFTTWQKQLGSRLMVVDYTDLVVDPDRTIRKIAQFCGLQFEPEMAQPEKAKRAVTTASASQVRNPINSAGLGAAQNYRDHLAPFITAYF